MSAMPAPEAGLGTREVLTALRKLASARSISTSIFTYARCDSAASLGFPPSDLHAAQSASLLRPTQPVPSEPIRLPATRRKFLDHRFHESNRIGAERDALVADLAFAVGAAAAGTFAAVWFFSPDEPRQRGAGITLRSYF